MVNENLRNAIAAYCEEQGWEVEECPLLLDDHAYDNSIVGITDDGRIIYDYDKMVEEFMNDEDCSEEDAIEWIEFNTVRALGYFGEHAPIIQTSAESILERYGD